MTCADTDIKNVIRLLLAVTVILVLCHFAALWAGDRFWHLERLFHLNFESNVPTWFSSFVLILGALTAIRCARGSLAVEERRVWFVLAVTLLMLSLDEVAMLHETLGKAVARRILRIWPQSFLNPDSNTWPIGIGPFIIAGLISLAAFVRSRTCASGETLKYLYLGAVLFLLGSMGFEWFANFMNRRTAEWLWQIEIVLEESFEMIGAITFLAGLFIHERSLKGVGIINEDRQRYYPNAQPRYTP